ncbi:MAG: NAD(P)-dependent oxidoreductase [Pseudomonadota bacterium]
MNVVVTGASGFVGRHVVRALLERGHSVTAVGRDVSHAQAHNWFPQVRFVVADVHAPPADLRAAFGDADLVIHLAWPGLPNYRQPFHLDESLPRDFAFLRALVLAGYPRLLAIGTCLECVPFDGCYSEDMDGEPTLPYPLAKARLRRQLTALQSEHPFVLQWARLFYMYGEGQNPASLLAQLDRAIDSGAPGFDMSGGEQVRDFSPVTDIAAMLVTVAEHPQWQGVTHVCSGVPITVRELVERHIASRRSSIRLNLGVFPYPDYEPMAFWGASARLPVLGVAR